MAGGYGHIVQKDGNLRAPLMISNVLEDGGDVFETVEEMYGMIWFLVSQPDQWAGREKQMVDDARRQYKEGLKKAKEFNG